MTTEPGFIEPTAEDREQSLSERREFTYSNAELRASVTLTAVGGLLKPEHLRWIATFATYLADRFERRGGGQ